MENDCHYPYLSYAFELEIPLLYLPLLYMTPISMTNDCGRQCC